MCNVSLLGLSQIIDNIVFRKYHFPCFVLISFDLVDFYRTLYEWIHPICDVFNSMLCTLSGTHTIDSSFLFTSN